MASLSEQTAGAEELAKVSYLNDTFEANSEAQQARDSSIKAVEDQIKSLNENLINLIKRVDSMQKQFSSTENNRTLEWAIQNASFLVNFAYRHEKDHVQGFQLILTILLNFRQGYGTYLPQQVQMVDHEGCYKECRQEKFESIVVNSIRELIGKAPVISDEQGKRCICMDSCK